MRKPPLPPGIPQDAKWIGRAEDCDVRINDDRYVDMYHAVTWQLGDTFYIADLLSTNGTRIGSVHGTVEEARKLSPGIPTPIPANARVWFGIRSSIP